MVVPRYDRSQVKHLEVWFFYLMTESHWLEEERIHYSEFGQLAVQHTAQREGSALLPD